MGMLILIGVIVFIFVAVHLTHKVIERSHRGESYKSPGSGFPGGPSSSNNSNSYRDDGYCGGSSWFSDSSSSGGCGGSSSDD